MKTHQTLPSAFAVHESWIMDIMTRNTEPCAWIFSTDQWIQISSARTTNRIEFFEQQLIGQPSLGVIRFTASINRHMECTILYLYSGTMFTYTLFHPIEQREQVWWVEPWSIQHMLK